ncbi:MAG: hypothetical protein ACM3SQ_15980 [Betaproteobacteria bacterium]
MPRTITSACRASGALILARCRGRLLPFAALAVLLGFPFAALAIGQLPNEAEHAAVRYTETQATDVVVQLQKRIDSGEVKLQFDPRHGYLPAVLDALKVPVSSQGLVFSRTSLQVDHIAPWAPRAVYFNDNVYVGWVQHGPIMEIASADPKLGAVFYTLNQQQTDHPVFERQGQTCLQCHDSSSTTGGVPGFILRSVLVDRQGYVISPLSDGPTTDRTPIDERWGGWYVTGTNGDQGHLGNLFAPMLASEVTNAHTLLAKLDRSANANVTDLGKRFDVHPYLAPTSDIVALLVLAHQAYVHNLITIASFETRKALYDEKLLLASRGAPEGSPHLDVTMMRVQGAGERLVRAMLFSKEAPLASPVKGTSGFAAEFVSHGPKDSQGRSLRDLDLNTRVFKYPLSYLIYSEDFDALPPLVKEYVYRRLNVVLSGADTSGDFDLSAADRQAILAILRDTKPDFTAFTANKTVAH